MKKITYEEMKQKGYFIKCKTKEQVNKVLDWIQLYHTEDLKFQKRKLWDKVKWNTTIGVTKDGIVSLGCGFRYLSILQFEDIELMKPNTYNEIKDKFDLERLRGKKVVVNCVTKEQFLNYKEFIYYIGCPIEYFNSWLDYKENTCIALNANLTWTYDEIDWYKESGYKVITYEEAMLKEDKLKGDNKYFFVSYLYNTNTGFGSGNTYYVSNDKYFNRDNFNNAVKERSNDMTTITIVNYEEICKEEYNYNVH